MHPGAISSRVHCLGDLTLAKLLADDVREHVVGFDRKSGGGGHRGGCEKMEETASLGRNLDWDFDRLVGARGYPSNSDHHFISVHGNRVARSSSKRYSLRQTEAHLGSIQRVIRSVLDGDRVGEGLSGLDLAGAGEFCTDRLAYFRLGDRSLIQQCRDTVGGSGDHLSVRGIDLGIGNRIVQRLPVDIRSIRRGLGGGCRGG